jgi:hypothetical protein
VPKQYDRHSYAQKMKRIPEALKKYEEQQEWFLLTA